MENNNNNDPEESQQDLISDYVDEMQQMEIEGYESVVRNARGALFLAAVLIFAGEILSMAISGNGFDYSVLIIAIVEAAVFVVLALWTKRRPYSAVLSGLIAFIGLYLAAAILNGIVSGSEAAIKTLVGGIILKIVVIVALVRALGNAKALQQHKKKARPE